MTRKPQPPNWSRLARTARVEASRLPAGCARDALIAKARKLEAAGKRERQNYLRPDLLPALDEIESIPSL